jgi:hypothetical protein
MDEQHEEIGGGDMTWGRADHLLQLFDSDESLAHAVSDFVGEGLASGDTVLTVIDRQRWNAVAMRLATRPADIDAASSVGQLVVRDAAETLSLFMRKRRPDADQFQTVVGGLVHEMARRRTRIRIYAEMVDILASQGNFGAAQALEEMWNQLAEHVPFTLFCGYSSADFGDPRSADALRRICQTHSGVRTNPDDALGSFLLAAHQGSAAH